MALLENMWAVLCTKVIEDKNTGAVSLIETVNKLTARVPPDLEGSIIVPSNLVLATMWRASEYGASARGRLQARLSAPTGEHLESQVMEVRVEAGANYRWFLNVEAVHLFGEGRYVFDLLV